MGLFGRIGRVYECATKVFDTAVTAVVDVTKTRFDHQGWFHKVVESAHEAVSTVGGMDERQARLQTIGRLGSDIAKTVDSAVNTMAGVIDTL